MDESHHDNSRQVHYLREKCNNESSMGNSKHKNLSATIFTKRGTLDMSVGLQKKKQPDANVTELVEGVKNSVTFYLLQTDQLVTKINGS